MAYLTQPLSFLLVVSVAYAAAVPAEGPGRPGGIGIWQSSLGEQNSHPIHREPSELPFSRSGMFRKFPTRSDPARAPEQKNTKEVDGNSPPVPTEWNVPPGGAKGPDGSVAHEKSGFLDDLEEVFDNTNPGQLEDSFKKLGESLKKIGEHIKDGIKKLKSDPNMPKIHWEKLKNINISVINVTLGSIENKLEPVKDSIDKVVETIPDAVEHQVENASKAAITEVKDRIGEAVAGAAGVAQEGMGAAKDVTTDGVPPPGRTDQNGERQLLDVLKDIRANRAARYSRQDESEPKDDDLPSLLHNFNQVKHSLDPEYTKQVLDDIKKNIKSMKANFDSIITEFKELLESKLKTSASRTKRGLQLTTENVTAFIDTMSEAFGNKDLNGAFQDMLTALNDIGDQMQSNIKSLDRGMTNLIAKYKNTSNTKGKRDKRDVSAQQGNDDLKKMREAIGKVKTTFDPDKIKAAFSKIRSAMKDLEKKLTEGLTEFRDVLKSEADQDMPEKQESLDTDVASGPNKREEAEMDTAKIVKELTVVFKELQPEDLEKPFLAIGKKIDNMSDMFQLSIRELKKSFNKEIQTKERRTDPQTANKKDMNQVKNSKPTAGEIDNQLKKVKSLSNQALAGFQQAVQDTDSVAQDALKAGASAKTKVADIVVEATETLIKEIEKSGIASQNAREAFKKAVKQSNMTAEEVNSKVKSIIDENMHKSDRKVKRTTEGKLRSKRQAAAANGHDDKEIDEILKALENISNSLQPQYIKVYNSQVKELFQNLLGLLKAALKDIVKCFHEIESRQSSGGNSDLQKRRSDVNNEIVTNLFVVIQNSFNQAELEQEFEVIWTQLEGTIQAMLNATAQLEDALDEHKNTVMESNQKRNQMVEPEKDGAAYSELQKILKNVMTAVNPDHVKEEFRKLNDKISDAKVKMDTSLDDFKKWALQDAGPPKSIRNLEGAAKKQDLPSVTKHIIENLEQLTSDLNPDDIEQAFNRLGEELEHLEKDIEKGVTKLENSVHSDGKNLKETVADMNEKISKAEDILQNGGGIINQSAGKEISEAKGATNHVSTHEKSEPVGKMKNNHIGTYSREIRESVDSLRDSKGTSNIISQIEAFIEALTPKEAETEFEKMQKHLRMIRGTTSIIADQSRFRKSRTLGGTQDTDNSVDTLKEVLDVDNLEQQVSKVQESLSETANLFFDKLQKAQNTLKTLLTDILTKDTKSKDKRKVKENNLIKDILDKIENDFKQNNFEKKIKELKDKIEELDKCLRSAIKDFIEAMEKQKEEEGSVSTKRDVKQEEGTRQSAIDVIEDLYNDLEPGDIKKAFADLGNQIKTFTDKIKEGFDSLKKDSAPLEHVVNKQTEQKRALIQEIRNALAQAKLKRQESKVDVETNQEENVPKLLQCLHQMREKLGDIQKLMDSKEVDNTIYKLSKELQNFNIQVEAAMKEILTKLTGITKIRERTRRGNDEQGFQTIVDHLRQSFNETEMNKQFTDIWNAMIKAVKQLQNGISKASSDLNKFKASEEKVKRSLLQAKNDRHTTEESHMIKMVNEITRVFDPDNIKKEFDKLNREIKKAEGELNDGIKEFEKWIGRMTEESNSISEREVLQKDNQHPSVDEVISDIETVFKDLKPDDIRNAFTDAGNKIKEIGTIFRSGIDKIEKDLSDDESSDSVNVKRAEFKQELLDEIFTILNATKPRKKRDTDEHVRNEDSVFTDSDNVNGLSGVQKGIDPKKVKLAFEKLFGRLKGLMAEFFEGVDQVSNSASGSSDKREAPEGQGQSFNDKVKSVFGTDKIAEAFREAVKSLKLAEGKVEEGIKEASNDMKALVAKQEEVKRALEDNIQRPALEETGTDLDKVYQELMDALQKVKSSISPDAIQKAFSKLNEEMLKVEEDFNEWLKKLESWILGHVKPAVDPKYGRKPSMNERRRREVTDAKEIPKEPIDDLNKAIEALSPDNMEKLDRLTQLVFSEAQRLANTMKDFGSKLKMPLPAVVDIPKTP